jgi:hypothetical protein
MIFCFPRNHAYCSYLLTAEATSLAREIDITTNTLSMWDLEGGCSSFPRLIGRCRACVRVSGSAGNKANLSALETDEAQNGLRFSSLVSYVCDDHTPRANAIARRAVATRLTKKGAARACAAAASAAAARTRASCGATEGGAAEGGAADRERTMKMTGTRSR